MLELTASSSTLIPRDRGPIYGETDLTRFPAEPWNTASIFLFLLLLLYWSLRIRGEWRRYWLISLSLPLFFVGFIGGLFYHACRCSSLWLKMDYIPIALLAIIAAVFFWVVLFREQRGWFYWGAAVVILFYLPALIFIPVMERQAAISLGYLNLSLLVLLPAFLHSFARYGRATNHLLFTVAMFGIALTFRVLDFRPWVLGVFPMGTHFLWHTFGAAAAFFLLQHLFKIEADKESANS